jgi:hypothetical protein
VPFSQATWGSGGRVFKGSSLRQNSDKAVIVHMIAYTTSSSGTGLLTSIFVKI